MKKEQAFERKNMTAALLCGMLGCVCFGVGDWLMIYGDTAYSGSVYWLTEGAAEIPAWRNAMAMGLAFPGIVLYGIALFAIEKFLRRERHRKVYRGLTAFGLTPWLCLHLFYIMILYVFAWLRGNGQAALPAAEALYSHLSWIVPLSEAIMLPPYLYWFWAVASGKSHLPKKMAVSNPLIFYAVLRLVQAFLPAGPFRIGFTNGLMSESMAFWFISLLALARRRGVNHTQPLKNERNPI